MNQGHEGVIPHRGRSGPVRRFPNPPAANTHPFRAFFGPTGRIAPAPPVGDAQSADDAGAAGAAKYSRYQSQNAATPAGGAVSGQ